MSAHDHFNRQVHGWGLVDFLSEFWHFCSKTAGARLSQLGWVSKQIFDVYYSHWYTDFALLYVLVCLVWVVLWPNKPLPRLLNRHAYALAVFSAIFYHRHLLWALFGPPFTRLPPIIAITAYAYLVFVRVLSTQ